MPLVARLLLRLRREYGWRRLRLRIRLAAYMRGAVVDLTIDPTVLVKGLPSVVVGRGSHTTLEIGRDTHIEPGVLLFLDGGRVTLGPHTRLRRWAVIRVRGGHLDLQGHNYVSYCSVIHCDEHITVEPYCGIAEHATVTDSNHLHPPEGEWFLHHITTAPVRLGAHAWIGAKVTVGPGVSVGSHTFVGANAVVTKDIPAGVNAGGIPARVLSRVDDGNASDGSGT